MGKRKAPKPFKRDSRSNLDMDRDAFVAAANQLGKPCVRDSVVTTGEIASELQVHGVFSKI